MKKLSQAELLTMPFRRSHRGEAARPFFAAISELAPGEGLLITKEEWPLKGYPTSSALRKRISEDRRYSIRILEDGNACVVIRVK